MIISNMYKTIFMKKIFVGLIIVFALFVVIKLSYDKSPEEESIKIGFVGALTGVGSAIGNEELYGAQLAVNEINIEGGILGKKLELVPEDVSLDKQKVIGAVAQKLIDIDKVVAIVGPQWDEPAFVFVPIIDKEMIPTIGVDNTDIVEDETPSEYFFSIWYDNRVGIQTILEYAEDQNIQTISIIRPFNSTFWKFVSDLMVEGAPEHGITVLDDIDLGNPLTLDFRTQITKLKQKKPEALFMVMSDFNECTFLRQLRELSYSGPVFATESAGNQASLRECPDLLENLYFSTPVNTDSAYSDFENTFEKQYGEKPAFPSAVTAYDAVYIIAEALEETEGEGGEVLKNAIASIDNFKGASQPDISFNEKGFVITPDDIFKMYTVRNGEFVLIKD